MLTPSQGFCYCLPVRLGALVVSLLAFLGSGILAGITFRSLTTISAHITSIQTAGFYLTSVSWISLSLFSLLGIISVILQHPLMLTIFARFILYHLPANLLCNLFFTVVLFCSYHDAEAVLHSIQCSRGRLGPGICGACASLQILTWLYLFILLPASIAQTYTYVIIKRFIFFISGEWDLERQHTIEVEKRSMDKKPTPDHKRRTTVTQSIGHRGRRRAKAQLWFTMETPDLEADDSFLPSMILTPMAFPPSPPRTPFSATSAARPPSPLAFPAFMSPRLEKKSSKVSLPPLPSPSPAFSMKQKSLKDGESERSARLGMDFSDPDPFAAPTRPAEWFKPGSPSLGPPLSPSPSPPQQSQQEPRLPSPVKARGSDASMYSVESLRVGSNTSTEATDGLQ